MEGFPAINCDNRVEFLRSNCRSPFRTDGIFLHIIVLCRGKMRIRNWNRALIELRAKKQRAM